MPTPVSECLYCTKHEVRDELMIKICDLEVSQLFLFKEQTHKGRCNVIYKDHGVDFHELNQQQREAYMRDVAKTGKAINEVFHPDKINYGAYSDKLSHLHFHIVPKYKDGAGFGGVFEMNPQKIYLTESEYQNIIKALRSSLASS